MQYFKFFGAALLFALVFNSHQARAQDSGLRIKPAILDIAIADEQTSASINIENLYGEPVGVEVEVRSLSPKDTITELATYYDARDLIRPEAESFLLEKGESRDFRVDLMKSDFPEGSGSYALLVFKVVNSAELNSSGVRVNTELAVVVIATSPGAQNEELAVSFDEISKYGLAGSESFTGFIDNLGSIHSIPIVKLELLNSDGDVIESETRNESLLLPGTRRAISFKSKNRLGTGRHKLRATVSYGNIGSYDLVESPLFLRVSPWLPIVGIVGTSTIVSATVLFIKKRHSVDSKA